MNLQNKAISAQVRAELAALEGTLIDSVTERVRAQAVSTIAKASDIVESAKLQAGQHALSILGLARAEFRAESARIREQILADQQQQLADKWDSLALKVEDSIRARMAAIVIPEGKPGRGFTWMGQWTQGTIALPYQLFRYNGSTFIATRETSEAPSGKPETGWEVVALAGASGGGGVGLSGATPQPLGTASAGSTGFASDAGHVHQMPTADQIPSEEFGFVELGLVALEARTKGIVPGGSTQSAEASSLYINVASTTYTDPSPSEGAFFSVLVRNGTATVGGVAYQPGTFIYRVFHSGAWKSFPVGTPTESIAGSVAADFAGVATLDLTVSGTATFTGTNYTAGVSLLYYLTASGGPHTLAFPSGWKFQTAKPTSIASGKTATLLLDSRGTTEAAVRAYYAEES